MGDDDRHRQTMTRWPEPEKPGPGQESVWDYPRPPRLEDFAGAITVELGGSTIASTNRGWRVLETSHPPTYYLPRECFSDGVLRPASGSSWCEWKGQASYFDLVTDTKRAQTAAWTYPTPDRRLRTDRGCRRGDGRRGRPLHRQR